MDRDDGSPSDSFAKLYAEAKDLERRNRRLAAYNNRLQRLARAIEGGDPLKIDAALARLDPLGLGDGRPPRKRLLTATR